PREAAGPRQLVADRLDAGTQFVAMRVGPTAIIAQGFHSSDANTDVHESFTPGASEAVGDNDRNLETRLFMDFVMQLSSGAIGIFGKKHSVPASIDVGDIDAVVGTQKSMMRLSDENSVLAANDSTAFA